MGIAAPRLSLADTQKHAGLSHRMSCDESRAEQHRCSPLIWVPGPDRQVAACKTGVHAGVAVGSFYQGR
jgi:hypothetical protein